MSLPRAKSRTGNPSLLLQLERVEKRRERKGIIIWSSTGNLILHFLSSSTRRWPTETLLLTTTTTTMWMTFIVTKGSGIWICGCSAQLLRSCYSPWSQFFPLNCNSSSKTILNINSSTPPSPARVTGDSRTQDRDRGQDKHDDDCDSDRRRRRNAKALIAIRQQNPFLSFSILVVGLNKQILWNIIRIIIIIINVAVVLVSLL